MTDHSITPDEQPRSWWNWDVGDGADSARIEDLDPQQRERAEVGLAAKRAERERLRRQAG